MLNNATILIADDEPIIGMGLSWAVRDAGGQVVGPAASVQAALALLGNRPVAGAILDVNLTDGLVSPVVEFLMERQIPLIVQTGVGIPDDLAVRYPAIIVRLKPNSPDDLIAELAQMILDREAGGLLPPQAANDTVATGCSALPTEHMQESSQDSGTAA